MDKLKKQTELNTSNNMNDEPSSQILLEFNELKSQLININEEYFSNVINSIENELMIDHLYASGALENEEKLNLFRREISSISDELSGIRKNTLNEGNQIFNVDDTKTMDSILEELNKLVEKTYLQTLRNEIEVSVEKTTNNSFNSNNQLSDLKKSSYKDSILGDVNDKNFVSESELRTSENKTLMKEVKKRLAVSRFHWKWYVIVVSILFVGLILAIVLPIYL